MKAGIMKGRVIEADFEADTLTFQMDNDYYARAGYFYIVPNTVFEELIDRGWVPGTPFDAGGASK